MKIGYLPLYIKLYDDIGSDRTPMQAFYDRTVRLFEERGLKVVKSDFCRIKPEFEKAIAAFEAAGVDAIVTWHAAYSPSLESLDALVKTSLPIIVFDSTPTLEFTPEGGDGPLMANHGIHGVMDMCSMLTRCGKPYALAAGHVDTSDVISRVCGFVRAAVAAKALSSMKVGLFGGAFDGMGDFAVEPAELKERFGISVEDVDRALIAEVAKSITDAEIADEIEDNKQLFDFDDNIVEEEYIPYVKSCLTLRKCVEKLGYTAFSANFLNVGALGTMPFVECCKAMSRGTGYAGEGDALTAAFTGAFMASYPETNFVEIFCPDWKSNNVFMSHMGETNYRISATKPLLSRTGSTFVKGTMPYAAYCRMKEGCGVYVNVSRDKDDYKMLIAPAKMLPAENDNFPRTIRGWMQPETSASTAEFLEKLSVNGATHHSTFIYGATAEEIAFFARLLSMKIVHI